jgi:hypothetical protein
MILVMAAAAGCTIHFPYDWEYGGEGRGNYRVVFQVIPDDAEVLVNSRMVGLAYEFSNRESALRLSSRNAEIVLKKRGYEEEEVDLSDFDEYEGSREMVVQVKLKPARGYGDKPAEAKEEKEAYEAKSEPVKAPPAEKEPQAEAAGLTAVAFTVTPAEAAIYIKGKFWGIAPADGKIANLKLAPGKYLFEVSKPGYKAFSKEIEIPKAEKFDLKIALEK